jgi:tetratricopeptide (TPR) repeat protein
MVGPDRLAEDEVMMLVDHLFGKSLVVWGEEGYRLLHSVREFGLDQLREHAEDENAKRRHFDYFREFARGTEARIRGPEQSIWYTKYSAAADDLRAALDFGFSCEDLVPAAGEMTFDLTSYWFNASCFREAVAYYRQAIDACPPGESDLRARLMRRGGMMAQYGGDQTAGDVLRAALNMAKRVGSEQTLADAYFSVGLYSKDVREATDNLEEALKMFEHIGDETGIGFCMAGIGEIAYVDGDYLTSRTFFRLSLERNQANGDVRSSGASIASLAAIDLAENKVEEARAALIQALRMIMETGVMFSIYSMFPLIIQFIEAIGQRKEAAQLMGWNEKIRREVGGIRDRMDQFIFDEVEQKLRAQLGEQAFSALVVEGAHMTNDEAVTLANHCLNA